MRRNTKKSGMLARGTLGLALAGSAVSSADAANCEVYRNRLAFASDASVDMIVRSGLDCRVRYPLAESIHIDSNVISERPRYGGARIDGTSAAYYRSNPGYRGPDRFTFTFCGEEGGKPGCSSIRVKVTVR
jgi:hypothetical protein